jgi:hypothetical protein
VERELWGARKLETTELVRDHAVLKSTLSGLALQCTPVIPATPVTEVGGSCSEDSQSRISTRPCLKTKNTRVRGMAQMIELLHEALSSIPNTAKKKKNHFEICSMNMD